MGRYLALGSLLLLLGFVEGFPGGMEYQFRYSSRVVAGLPSLKQQYSAIGLQADLTMQVTEGDIVIFQMSNVEMGYFHDELHCDPSAPVPIEYQPIDNEDISKPFTLHLNGSEPRYMEGPSELAWITNLRKAVANIVSIPPLMGRRSSQPTFMVEEETMAGRCYTWYTLLKLSEYEATMANQRQEAAIEEDAQATGQAGSLTSTKTGGTKTRSKTTKTRSKTSKTASKTTSKTAGALTRPDVEGINWDLWTLTRSIRFNTCHGGFRVRIHGNKAAGESIEQSSTSRYLVRGEVGKLRLERAVVTGSITVFPDPRDQTHSITAITNQTLELVAVRPLRSEIPLDYQPVVQHYNFHFTPQYLPGTVPGRRPSLVEALTGVPTSPETVAGAQDVVVEYIKFMAQSPLETTLTAQTVTTYVKKATDILADFTQEEIEAVQSKLPSDNADLHTYMINILQRLVIWVGTEPAVRYIIQQLSNPETFNLYVYLSFFSDEPISNIKNPALIPEILDLVMMPNENVPQGLQKYPRMSIAKLIHELCLDPEKDETTTFTTCDTHYTCDTQKIFDIFIPALRQDIQNTELVTRERDAALQALCNLGVPSEINTLKNVILGTHGEPLDMRMYALYCLDAHHMPASARSTILPFLLIITENKGEIPEVRSLAFLSAATWVPDVLWWHRMALSTWHEPSAQVASFISSTLASLAQSTGPRSVMAGRSVHLAKPSAPASLTHSTFVYVEEVLRNCEDGDRLDVAWLASRQSLIPSHILYRHLSPNSEFGELFAAEMKQFLGQTFPPLFDTYHKTENEDDARLVWEEFMGLVDALNIGPVEVQKILSPKTILDDTVISGVMGATVGGATAIVVKALESVTNRLYFKPERRRDTTIALATDIGLPVVVEYTTDTVVQYVTETGDSNALVVGTKAAVRLSKENTLELRCYLPCERGIAVAAGITNTLSSTLSFKFSHAIDPTTRSGKLVIELPTQDEVDVLFSRNLPYTALTSPYPVQNIPEGYGLKEINILDIPSEGEALPAATGVFLHYSWRGDFPLPKKPDDKFNDVLWPGPTFHKWLYRITLRPQQSTTTKLVFKTIFSMRSARMRQPEVVEEEEIGQVSQGAAAEYDYMGQVSQSSSDYQEFGQEGFAQEIGGQVQEPDRFGRLQQEVEPVHGGTVGTVGLALDLLGADDRGPSYEAALTFSRSTDNTATRLILALTTFPPQGTLAEPKAVCFDLSVQKPPYPPRRHPIQPEDLHATTSFNIQYGTSCNSGPPVMKVEGTLDVSAEALAKVVAEHSPECGDIPSSDRNIFFSPVYDQINFHAAWTEEMPPYLLNMTQHLDDDLRVWLHPHITYDHTITHPPRSVRIYATRSPDSDLWDIVTEKPDGVSLVEDLKAPSWFQTLVVPGDLPSVFTYRYLYGEEDQTCVLSETEVRTLDGRVYSFEPTSCWAAAVFRYGPEERSEPRSSDISVQVRFVDDWEVRLLYPWLGFYIELTRDNVMLNGQIFSEATNAIQFQRLEDGITLKIPRSVIVTISDSVSIKLAPQYAHGVRGLCGAPSGEQIDDLIGPQGCLYTDPELFVHSWSTSGEGCNRFTLRANKGKVAEYQEACPHQVYQATGSTQPNANISCTEWGLGEKDLGYLHCTSLTKIPHCKPGCVPTFTRDEMLKYKCKPSYIGDDDSQCRTVPILTHVTHFCTPS